MEIPKEFGQWMKDYKLQVSEDNVVEPYQHLGLPCYGCELNSGKLELTPSPRPLDESEVGIALSKLKELSTAITILDECSCAYYLYTECVKDMPSCDLQKMLEHVLMVFIIVRLFACGKGYNDAILHCLKSNHNQFRHYWSILERLRNKSIAHTDADPSDCKTHHSEGIDKRITHKWELSQGTETPDIVFTDEYAKDSSIDVNSILGTVRFSPSDKEAVDKIIRPHSNSLRGILRYMYQTWHNAVYRLEKAQGRTR